MQFTRVLVTGGAGFIGANYVRWALDAHPEWEMVVFDKLTYAGNLANLDGLLRRITFVQGDITHPEKVRQVMTDIEAVVHFAAETHVDRSLVDPYPFLRTNVEGTVVLLEAARQAGVRRFLHVSTDEVYGDLAGTDRCSREEDPLRPRNPYAASKAAAEHFVFSYGSSRGLDVVLTRGSNTYGPYQYPEKIIPFFVTNALEDHPLPLYGDGSAVRDYMHVEDHAAGIDCVLHRGAAGEAYNLGAGESVSGLEVAQRILGLLGKSDDLLMFTPDRPGHDYRYSLDTARANALGWHRCHAFPDGLAQTVAWYRQHDGWWRPLKDSAAFRAHLATWHAARSC